MKPIASLVATAALACSGGVIIAAPAAAAEEAPDALVQRVFTGMLDAVKADPALRAGDRRKLADLVEERFLPYVHFQHMTTLAVGRFWRQATPEQQMRLVSAVRKLVVHAYADALAQAADGTPTFFPARGGPQDDDIEVRSQVPVAGGALHVFNYRLEKLAHYGWKVYDLDLSDGWLVVGMKSSFAAEIAKGGIDGLVSRLEARNHQWERGLPAASRR
ncbi:phospholipid-binding protein MlaC [uncultured Massilia sp.]|uniref:MlaC/ttg2D family ABC transporter substrate-binding protein n=1 Tax=uncultured Massilia sp. TaxID=169973 RepID=UPI0025F6E548|nr:ABC transporter substrate-binding protein [uncultured Massilia sp.]